MSTVNPSADRHHDANRQESPDVGDIVDRPTSPAVIRFLGCDAEMAGLNTDFFTAGRTDDCDLMLPDALGGDPSIVLRFSRGPEGWRVSPSDHAAIFVNQEQVFGLTGLRSGDVIRFVPGGAGMQFTIVHQNSASLAGLAAKYAPRLLGEKSGDSSGRARDDSASEGASPLRYESGAAPTRRTAADVPAPGESRSRLDPAVMVAASILIAGFVAGAAFLYSGVLANNNGAPTGEKPSPTDPGQPSQGTDPPAGEREEVTEETPPPIVEAPPTPDKDPSVTPASPEPEVSSTDDPPLVTPSPTDDSPAVPDDNPFSDL